MLITCVQSLLIPQRQHFLTLLHLLTCMFIYMYYWLNSAYEGDRAVFFLRLYDLICIYSKSIHFPANFVTSFF